MGWALFFVSLRIVEHVVFVSAILPCNTSSVSSCTGFLFHKGSSQSPQDVARIFSVDVSNVALYSKELDEFLISVNCACRNSSFEGFSAIAQYSVQGNDSSLQQISDTYFNSMVFFNGSLSNMVSVGEQIQLHLLCGCAGADWQYVLSYQIQQGDTLFELAGKFSSDVDTIQHINGLVDPNRILAGNVLFIPTNTNPATSSQPEAGSAPATTQKSKNTFISIVVVAVACAVFILIAIFLVQKFYFRSKRHRRQGNQFNDVGGFYSSGDIHYIQNSKKGFGSSFMLKFSSLQRHGSINNNVKRNLSLPKEAINAFETENPVIFSCEEIAVATNNFDESKKLGQGAYGSVYLGTLCNQEVAIKQMKATKTREFTAELRVLCKVHHTNLVELIGYSVGEDDLFLVYEFAKNGALSDHLHDPINKGYQPLSWTVRVQIALDSARGLEYIHEHTKTQYVHRDVKTSNILLDGFFRAKLADFGLAKLIEHVGDGEINTTRVVGTFGYLAPEYVRDGQATSKVDVFAFGVVLMELISGQEALSKTKSNPNFDTPDRRSLISIMLSIFQEKEPLEGLKSFVDPYLQEGYPMDVVFKIAKLAKACVGEDPTMRPDMRQIVFDLSQNLVSSIEWEAALAGNSQVFSGLLQGR